MRNSACGRPHVRRPPDWRDWPSRPVVKTIVFAQSRLMVEVLTKYLKDVFDRDPRQRGPRLRLSGWLYSQPAARHGSKNAGRRLSSVLSTTFGVELGIDLRRLDVPPPTAILVPSQAPGSNVCAAPGGAIRGPRGSGSIPPSSPLRSVRSAPSQYVSGPQPEPRPHRSRIDSSSFYHDHVAVPLLGLPFIDGERFWQRYILEKLSHTWKHKHFSTKASGLIQ